jgi:ferredoxin
MKISVDLQRCEDHGQCVFAAPSIFSLDDNDKFFGRRLTATYEWVSDSVDPGDLTAVEDAISICPVQAISTIDELASIFRLWRVV